MLLSYIVAVPCYDIERSMLLRRSKELATKLVYDIPVLVVLDLVVRNRVEEISCVRETIGTERTELGKLKVGTPDLENVPTRRPIWKVDLVFLTTLDNADLAWLDEELTELSLDVEGTLLRNDKEVTVRINECTLGHGGVGAVYVAVEIELVLLVCEEQLPERT